MEVLTELVSLYAEPAVCGACVCQGLGEIQMDIAFLLVFSLREEPMLCFHPSAPKTSCQMLGKGLKRKTWSEPASLCCCCWEVWGRAADLVGYLVSYHTDFLNNKQLIAYVLTTVWTGWGGFKLCLKILDSLSCYLFSFHCADTGLQPCSRSRGRCRKERDKIN